MFTKTTCMTGIERIAQERQEQIEKHGWTILHDVEHERNGSLAQFAAQLALPDDDSSVAAPWGECPAVSDKLEEAAAHVMRKPRIGRLAVAGALIAAEIDRLQAISENPVFVKFRAAVQGRLAAFGISKIEACHEDMILSLFDEDFDEKGCAEEIRDLHFDT